MRLTRAVVIAVGAQVLCAQAPESAPPAAPPPEVHELTLAEICARVKCRTDAAEIRLVAQDGGSFRYRTQGFPFADPDGNIVIYPGEALEFGFDRNDISHPKFLRAVASADTADDGMFTLSFDQMNGQPYMMLNLHNATGVALRYDATLYVPAREGMRVVRTSACPVLAGMTNTESWPHPVVMLELSNFRIEGMGAGVTTVSCQ